MSDQQHFHDTSMHQKLDKGKLANSGGFAGISVQRNKRKQKNLT